jgi:predicted glycoside hydrolase/deacetylase ChbG (UPF0249 family)
LRHPDDATGIEVAGQIDLVRLEKVLTKLAARGAPSAEIAVHPGEPDDPDRHRYQWGYHWAEELEALTSPAAREAVERHGFTLATYDDLPLPAIPGE